MENKYREMYYPNKTTMEERLFAAGQRCTATPIKINTHKRHTSTSTEINAILPIRCFLVKGSPAGEAFFSFISYFLLVTTKGLTF